MRRYVTLAFAAGLLLLLSSFHVSPAQAEGVTTCANASRQGTDVLHCLDALVYQPLPVASTTLVLTCPGGSAGLQDQAQCRGNVWKPLSQVLPTELVGYCAQAQLTPYQVCDYPGGKEGYRVASTIFGSMPDAPGDPAVGAPSTIIWTTPLLNADGSQATITGYRIEYGIGDFSHSVTTGVTNSYTLTNLAPGTWQARVIALSAGGESTPSNVLTFDVTTTGTTGSCGAAPATATQTVSCPSGYTGSWTQTHGWSSAAYPTCWSAQPWTPTSAPAGTCAAVAAKPWVVSGTGSQPVYEAVLPLSGSALVRGTQQGTVAAGKTCGSEVFKVGSTSYRQINEADASLVSPSYQGRSHTAACAQQ